MYVTTLAQVLVRTEQLYYRFICVRTVMILFQVVRQQQQHLKSPCLEAKVVEVNMSG